MSSRNKGLVQSVDAIGMTAADLDRSIDFYSEVLSFEKVSEVQAGGSALESFQGVLGLNTRTARMRLGDEFIELTEYVTPEGSPFPPDSRGNDRWFQHISIVVSDMDQAYQRLKQNQVQQVSPEPQLLPDWNQNAAGIRVLYFKDPDGHFLEICQFPDGIGDSKWQRTTNRLFLGVDHTAIVVEDSDATGAFYRDLLGFQVVGQSENYGPEQERLSGVPGARVRITSLRLKDAPGIECLEYLSPEDGRPFPASQKANDLAHWQTMLVVRNANASEKILRSYEIPFVSTGSISMPDDRLGFARGFLVRDPTGHVVGIIEK